MKSFSVFGASVCGVLLSLAPGSVHGQEEGFSSGSFVSMTSKCPLPGQTVYAEKETLCFQFPEGFFVSVSSSEDCGIHSDLSCIERGYSKQVDLLDDSPLASLCHFFVEPDLAREKKQSLKGYTSPESILEAHRDDACWKSASLSGSGHFAETCGDNEERSLGLCYPKCPPGKERMGPICWDACDGEDYGISVGAICCKDQACVTELGDVSAKISIDVAKIAMDGENIIAVIEDLKNLYDDLMSLDFDQCQETSFSLESILFTRE